MEGIFWCREHWFYTSGFGTGETVPSSIHRLRLKTWTKSEISRHCVGEWISGSSTSVLQTFLGWVLLCWKVMIHSFILLIKSVLSFQEIRSGITKKGETLSWLKSRLKILIEVSSEDEAQKQGDELAKLSSSFKALGTLLSEVSYLFTR